MFDIFEIFLSLIDGFIITDFLLRFNHLEWQKNKRFIAFALVMGLIVHIVSVWLKMSVVEILAYAMGGLIISRFTDVKIKANQSLLSVLFILMIMVVVSSITAELFVIILDVDLERLLENGTSIRIFCSLMIKMMIIAFSNFVIRINNTESRLNFVESIMLLLIQIFSVFIMQIGFKYHNFLNNNEMIVLIIGVLLIDILVYLVYDIINKISAERIKYATELQALKYENNAIAQLKETEKNIREIKHEIKNKMYAVIDILDEAKSETAKEQIYRYINEIDRIYEYAKTSNTIFNYVLNYFINLAKSRNIDVSIFINPNVDFKMSAAELSSLLNNLLSNAIEALENQVNPYLYIEASKYAEYQKFVVANSIESSVLSDNADLKTTKNNKHEHGFGVPKIKHIVENHDGYIDIRESNGKFVVTVFI